MKIVHTLAGRLALLAVIITFAHLAGCSKKGEGGAGTQSEDAFLYIDEDTTPEHRKYLLAAKPFAIALASRKYDDVHALFSSHAKARMSLNQFAPDDNEAVYAKNNENPMRDVTAAQFGSLMEKVEALYGKPSKPKSVSVFSTDPDVLNRRSKDQFGAMDSMFAIGAMPDSIPADIRRASLRGQIGTELSREKMESIAKERGIAVENLNDLDLDPYFNFKIVLVEEDGQLKVSYFEFLPPSMLD